MLRGYVLVFRIEVACGIAKLPLLCAGNFHLESISKLCGVGILPAQAQAGCLFHNSSTSFEIVSKPSTAKCDLNTYTLFLLTESKYPGCTRLAEILEHLSHDSVNRFLLRERYNPKIYFWR